MYIFLKHNNEKKIKGILIITHKETVNKNLFIYFKLIHEYYYILVHNGSVNKPRVLPYITCNLTTQENCINNRCIPYTSRNFLDNIFNNTTDSLIYKKFQSILEKYNLIYDIEYNNKIFDFICVNRSSPIKLTFELLEYIIELLKGTDKTCCFIIIEDDITNPYYLKIMKLYNNNKMDRLLFINGYNLNKIKGSIWTGLSREDLSILYKLSKVYMHCCENEGESRTIHEAIACGCMVLAKDNMKGGGLDYLNRNNALLYNNKNYFKKMLEILYNYNNYIYDNELFKKLNITYSLQYFKQILYNNLYINTELSYDEFDNSCNIDNMMDKLPAHDISEPWYLPDMCTADIKYDSQIRILNNILFK
tara:strand:- start:4162 stop:5250 length:1089 start_codon:yes stop_codon:yes gene_type:complete